MNPNSLVYQPMAGIVSRTLLATGAYLIVPNPSDRASWYRWKSGIVAPVYTDCRRLARDPGATDTIARSMSSAIRATLPECDCVVGTAEAGVVWSALIAHKLGKPHAFVRKVRKEHGTSALVECSPEPGCRALVVDDLMAGGGSVEKAVTALKEEAQITTAGVMTIVNWNFEEMRTRFARLGIPYRALVSFDELLMAAVHEGQLTVTAAKELARFYRNPRLHQWDLGAFERPRKSA